MELFAKSVKEMNNATQHAVRYYKNEKELDGRRISDIIDIYKSAFSRPPWNYKPTSLREVDITREIRFALNSSTGAIITVEKNDKVIGFRIVSKMSDIVSNAAPELIPLFNQLSKRITNFPEGVSYTQILAIRRDYIGNGVASTLVQEHLKYAKESNCDYVLGWTVTTNVPMVKIYRKYGYELIQDAGINEGIVFRQDANNNPIFHKDYEIGEVTYYLKDLRSMIDIQRDKTLNISTQEGTAAPLVKKGVNITVYSKENMPKFSESDLDYIGKIGEKAYFNPPWGRVTYFTCNSCNAIYGKNSIEEAKNHGGCKDCGSELKTTERSIAEFFREELKSLTKEIESGKAILIVAENDGKIVGARLAINYGTVRDEARSEALPSVTGLIEHLGINPYDITYTVDMFVDPAMTRQGLATKMMEAHIEYAQKAGFKAMLGWTEDDNLNMIHRYSAFGFNEIPGFNMGIDYNPHFREKRFRVSKDNQDSAKYFIRIL